MKHKTSNKRQDTNSGDLRTPVTFYQYQSAVGPEPGEGKETVLHQCLCEAYNPSMKDLSIMDTTGTREAVTVKIRDTLGEYLPTNKHSASLDDYRYTGKKFSVVDVRHDTTDNRFIIILLGVVS